MLPFWARVIPPMAWQAPLVIRVVRAVEKAVREFQKQGDLPKLWLKFGWYKTTNICSCILLNPILYSLTTNIWLIKIGAKHRSSSLNYLSTSMNQNLYFGIPTHTYIRGTQLFVFIICIIDHRYLRGRNFDPVLMDIT